MNVLRPKAWLAPLLMAWLVVAFSAGAHAQTTHTIVAALGEELDPRWVSSLREELGLRSLSLVLEPSLPGDSLEARQQAAQARTEAVHAHATLWLEEGQVHALAADGSHRYAVLPRRETGVSPRVFAIIAMSALDELNIVVPVVESESVLNEDVVIPTPRAAQEETVIEDAQPDAPADQPTEAPSEISTAEALTAPQGALDLPTSDPREPSFPRGQPATSPSLGRDGDVHGYFALDGLAGAVWIFGVQNNVAHLLQRFTGGLQWELLRAEFGASIGLEKATDSGYAESGMGDFVFFVGAGIPVEDVSIDVGALGGLVVHGLADASAPRSVEVLTSGRLGAAIGISTPDVNSALVFRARIEFGLFARINPELATAFTNVSFGIGFR